MGLPLPNMIRGHHSLAIRRAAGGWQFNGSNGGGGSSIGGMLRDTMSKFTTNRTGGAPTGGCSNGQCGVPPWAGRDGQQTPGTGGQTNPLQRINELFNRGGGGGSGGPFGGGGGGSGGPFGGGGGGSGGPFGGGGPGGAGGGGGLGDMFNKLLEHCSQKHANDIARRMGITLKSPVQFQYGANGQVTVLVDAPTASAGQIKALGEAVQQECPVARFRRSAAGQRVMGSPTPPPGLGSRDADTSAPSSMNWVQLPPPSARR